MFRKKKKCAADMPQVTPIISLEPPTPTPPDSTTTQKSINQSQSGTPVTTTVTTPVIPVTTTPVTTTTSKQKSNSMLTNTILDTFFGITSLILKPFSLRLIWPELHHLHSLFALFQLIFFAYFFTRYISWPLDKNTPPPPPSLPLISAISMLEAILDLANLPTFKSTSVEVSLTGMAMWLSFLFVHRSFGSFETWFLFHKQQTKNTKNHSLPIIVKIMATLLIAAFVNGQLWLLLSALDGNESSISAPPGVLNGGFFLKFTTLMYFGITSAISGEIPSIAGVELFATTPSHFLWASIITFSSIGLYAGEFHCDWVRVWVS